MSPAYINNSTISEEGTNLETGDESPWDPRVVEIFNTMTLEEKVGQLFLARVPETNQVADIQAYSLGGYLIFGRDVEGETQESLRQKIETWQDSSNTPLIIASDEEGGYVTRVSEILDSPFESPGNLYANGGLDAVLSDTAQKSALLKSLGINVNLAPVADIAINPNSFIYDRTLMLPIETSLAEAAQITSEYVSGVVTVMNENKIGSCLKHFPGYGENDDSHTDIIHDEKDLATFEEIDFIPFEAGIQAGAGSVLISHNIAVAIDPTQPASLSPQVHNILRDQLGFNGVIITDDFDMAGLADFADQETAAIQTINAGTDMIISSSYADQSEAIIDAVNDGRIAIETIDTAVLRNLTWKYNLGILQ